MGSLDLRSIACGYQAYKHAAGSPLSAFNLARSSSGEERTVAHPPVLWREFEKPFKLIKLLCIDGRHSDGTRTCIHQRPAAR